MTAADTAPRPLPRTSDNLLLHAAGEGTGVRLSGIAKDFGATRVLHGVDIDVAPGSSSRSSAPQGAARQRS